MKLFDRLINRKQTGTGRPEGGTLSFTAPGHPAPPGLADSFVGDEEISLAYNLRVFERYNEKKTEFLYEQLPLRKRVVFDLIPLLLHVDAADLLLCADACRMSPHGVYGFQVRPQSRESFAEAFPGIPFPKLRAQGNFDPDLPVKSIALMGSMGSVAQNTKSDLDYWICIDKEAFSRETFIYFQEKLMAIERWAEEFAGAEVHCFPLDKAQIQVDDFGAVSKEGSGTAQGKLLKEEFYRSLTLIAGQVPMWWVMPPGVSDSEYDRLASLLNYSHRINVSSLVEMGNVHNISLGEYYGAAIWQINKTIGSPFKSVLKMALLEEYISNRGGKGLLCDELKRRILFNEKDIQFLDPYILMFERASTYLTQDGRQDDLELLRRSLYLKSGCRLNLTDYRRTDLPRKTQVMVNLIRSWGWSHRDVERLNTYHNWTFRESQKYSQDINRFIIRAYKNITRQLAEQDQNGEQRISQRDLTVLGRKLFIFYSRRTNKVDSIKNVIESPPALNGLTLQPHINATGHKVWAAYRGLHSRENILKGGGTSALLRSSPYLTAVLIWLVNNRLYDARTTVNLNSGPSKLGTYSTVPELHALLKELMQFFPPLKLSELNEDEMLQKPRIIKMFLVINLEEPDSCKRIEQTAICYQNNWGEVFFKGYDHSEAGLQVSRDFVRKRFAFDPLGALSHFKVFLPNRQFKRDLAPRLNRFFGFKAVI